MLSNIAAANKETIESWEGYKLSPVSVEKHVDLRYITGNTTLGEIKSKINTLSREYNPTKAGIEALMDRINSLGDVNIIWIDGDLKLNGTSIPNVNIFKDGKDLIVLKSNNLSEIFSTLRQYFYEKVINADDYKMKALSDLIESHITQEALKLRKVDSEANKQSLEELKQLHLSLTFGNLVQNFLYNSKLGKILDSHVNIQGQSGREEVNVLLEELTKTITSKRVQSTSRYRANPTSPNIAEHFVIVPDPQRIYRNRTIANATESDITIALAENFNTDGEHLTAKSAGEKLVKSELNKSSQEIADELWQQIVEKGLPQENILLNIAGNSIQRLTKSQEEYDRLVLEVISFLQQKGLKIREVRSRGQTGIDEAGTKAAIALNLPWTVFAPEGYAMQFKPGKFGKSGKEAFIKRFDPNYSEGIATINGVDDNGDGTLTITNPQTKETYIVRADKYKMVDDLLSISSRRIFPDPKLTAKSGGSITYNRTWEGIISEDITSTTKVLTGKNDKFWSELKPNTIIKFRNTFDKNDPNAEYIYVTVTGVSEITLDMANDSEFIQNWAAREGLSESYFKANILPKIKAGQKVYQVSYRLSDSRYDMSGIRRRQQLIEDAKTMRDYILGTKKLEDADMVQRFMSKFLNTEC